MEESDSDDLARSDADDTPNDEEAALLNHDARDEYTPAHDHVVYIPQPIRDPDDEYVPPEEEQEETPVEEHGACREVMRGIGHLASGLFMVVKAVWRSFAETLVFHSHVDEAEMERRAFVIGTKMMLLILIEFASLFLMIGIVTLAGMSGPIADATHTSLLTTEIAAPFCVALSVAVYILGVVDVTDVSTEVVVMFHLLMQVIKIMGDFVTAMRLAVAFKDSKHIAQILLDESMLSADAAVRDDWTHNTNAHVHLVYFILLSLCSLGVVTGSLIVFTVIWHRPMPRKLKLEDPPSRSIENGYTPRPKPRSRSGVTGGDHF